MIKNNQIYHLEGLEKEACLKLFIKHAYVGRNNPSGKFGDIADKMVEKLSRCPLAVKFIANFLNTCMDETSWTNILNANIANIKPDENGLLDILKLSYFYLPDYLQNCFTFCSIFPQDYEFDRDDSVRMWIAVGFIQSSYVPGDTLENTGRIYFNFLVQHSFFEEFHNDIYYHYGVYYKMHDLLHDLAQSVSMKECTRVVDVKEFSILETTRHLSIHSPSLEILKVEKLKNLRSFILDFSDFAEFDENVISQILKASERIRLLVIRPPEEAINMPVTIDCLIHLRYLNVRSGVLKIQRCISHLYHLQFVISNWPGSLVMEDNISWEELKPNKNCQLIMDKLNIPRDISALLKEPLRSISSLRYLTIEENYELDSFPTEIEQWFLKHRSTIFGLSFMDLSSLRSLPSLSTFSSLKFAESQRIQLLKSFPDLPSSLKKLDLFKFESLESLPSSLSAISSLDILSLIDIPHLKSMPNLPSSLKILYIMKLKSLQCLPSSLSATSSLETLDLDLIPLLESLSNLPSSLKRIGLTQLKSLQYLPSSLSAASSLETLDLGSIPLLESLPNLPSSLKKINLIDLKSLQYLPSSLSATSSLETLALFSIPLLESLPDLPFSLKKIYLAQLDSLKCLPSSLLATSSLETLRLDNIPLLKSLLDLPSSLEVLELWRLRIFDALPSCLPTRLCELRIENVPGLLELPDLPASLKVLVIGNYDCQLKGRYKSFRHE